MKAAPIEVLVDIRSNPVSRFARFANKAKMPPLLEAEGVEYRWMGDTLGGKPEDSSFYNEKGRPDFEKMRTTSGFREGIAELAELAQEKLVAIMCAEEDPTGCHRTLLVAPELQELGFHIVHVRAKG